MFCLYVNVLWTGWYMPHTLDIRQFLFLNFKSWTISLPLCNSNCTFVCCHLQPAGWNLKEEYLPSGWLCLVYFCSIYSTFLSCFKFSLIIDIVVSLCLLWWWHYFSFIQVCGASNQELPPNFIKLAKDAYTPDLIAASDCMLGQCKFFFPDIWSQTNWYKICLIEPALFQEKLGMALAVKPLHSSCHLSLYAEIISMKSHFWEICLRYSCLLFFFFCFGPLIIYWLRCYKLLWTVLPKRCWDDSEGLTHWSLETIPWTCN